MLRYTVACVLPLLVVSQYAMGPQFGGGGGGAGCGCSRPMMFARPVCRPRPMPMCPPQRCPPQFCPPPPICPPPPPPMPCPPPPPAPSCPCSAPMTFYQQYVPQQSYPMPCGQGGGGYMQPRIPAQNDCCCGCASPCRFKSRRRFAAFGAKTVDPSCNNSELKDIILENITSDGSESKRAIQKAAEDKLGHRVNVICGRGEFSYIAHTDSFCQTSKDDVTCYAFKPV